MFLRVWQLAFFVSLALALCTLARPALAMPAGLCDDRGATAIAPAPALQAPEEAIQRASAPASCAGRDGLARATIAPAHRGLASASADPQPAFPVGRVALAAAEGDKIELGRVDDQPLRGMRPRVERPPRD
jgi:hypothetical protein